MKSYSISQRKKSRGNLTWYGRTFENGVLVDEVSLKTRRKADAMDWLDAMNASRFMPEKIRDRIAPKDKNIDDAMRVFLTSVEADKGRDSSTYRAYRSRLGKWEQWCRSEGIVALRGFTVEHAASFSAELNDSFAPKSQKEMLRCLRQFISFCRDAFDMQDYDPMKGIKSPKVPKRIKEFWTPEEIDRILDQAPTPEFRLFWSLMAFAGLRYSEAYGFGSSNIVGKRIKIVGKGNKECLLPISDRLKAEFSLCAPRDDLFKGQRYRKAERANWTLRCAVARAGLPNKDATNHKFRHSFASNLVRANINDRAVQMLMRHEDVRITLETYSHLRENDLVNAVNARPASIQEPELSDDAEKAAR